MEGSLQTWNWPAQHLSRLDDRQLHMNRLLVAFFSAERVRERSLMRCQQLSLLKRQAGPYAGLQVFFAFLPAVACSRVAVCIIRLSEDI